MGLSQVGLIHYYKKANSMGIIKFDKKNYEGNVRPPLKLVIKFW